MPSQAFTLLHRKKRHEILEIAKIFESLNNGPGPNKHYSLLNGGLILLISSWEVYCEDVCRQANYIMLQRPSVNFEDLSERLRRNSIRSAGDNYRGNRDPLREKIALLAGEGWRRLLQDNLDSFISDFNTPKFSRARGRDLEDLFQHVLSGSLKTHLDVFLEESGWCDKLDDIVTLRGEIAHKGDAQPENRLSPEKLRNHTRAFVETAAAIDCIIHKEFRERFGFAPWQITAPIRNSLRQEARSKIY